MRINSITAAWTQERKGYLFLFLLVLFFIVFLFIAFVFIVLFSAALMSLLKAFSKEISPEIFIHPNTAELTDRPELCSLNLIDKVIEFIWALHKLVFSCIYG